MIAAVCSWHEHHELAANEIDRRLARREKMIVAAPALVETYKRKRVRKRVKSFVDSQGSAVELTVLMPRSLRIMTLQIP